MLHRAVSLTIEYYRYDAATMSLETSKSWEPAPLKYTKVNFDGSARGAKSGAKYVIQDSDDRLLTTMGFFL